MNKWHEFMLGAIQDRRNFIEWIKQQLEENPSKTATIPQPWASMTAKEIKESMGVYK